MSTQTFHCPQCNAPLTYEDTGAVTVRCAYCGATVIVPEMLRQAGGGRRDALVADDPALAEITALLARNRKIEAIKVFRDTYGVGLKQAKEAVEALERGEAISLTAITNSTSGASGGSGCVIGGILAVLTVFVVGASLLWMSGDLRLPFLDSEPASTDDDGVPDADGPSLTLPDAPELPLASSFVDEALVIGGEEGIGPGFFQDTRWLGVDGAGNIYAADFDGGRVQVFAADGAFRDQWTTGSGGTLAGIAVDRAGTVTTLEQGLLFRYEGLTGAPLGQLSAGDEGPAPTRYDDIALAANGDLLAIGDDRLVRFDDSGAVVAARDDLFAQLPADATPTVLRDMALDGQDNLYVIFVFDAPVYRFDRDGAYADRFGQEGDGEGDFSSPTALAVDGRGRVLVSDGPDLMLFDSAGRFVKSTRVDGVAFDMVFDDENALYRMDRNGNRIVKYELTE